MVTGAEASQTKRGECHEQREAGPCARV